MPGLQRFTPTKRRTGEQQNLAGFARRQKSLWHKTTAFNVFVF
jgi:hypothetical protein